MQDSVTGLKGIVNGKTQFLSGCSRYEINTEGKEDIFYADEQYLKLIKKATIKPKTHKPFIFKLGDYVKDIYTNKTYIVYGVCNRITGYNQYYVKTIKGELISLGFEENEMVKCYYWFKSNVLDNRQISRQTEEMNNSPIGKPILESKPKNM